MLLGVLESVLENIRVFKENLESDIHYSYAYSVISLLQSGGEQMHAVEIPVKKIEEYLVKSIDESFIQKVKEERCLIKNYFKTSEMLRLTQIMINFLKQKLNQGNFGGVTGANYSIICKLNLATQMASTIDLGLL